MSKATRCKVWKKRRISNTYFWVLLLISYATFAQNLCNQPAGTEVGGFTLLTPAVGCSPFNVKIQDNSGGTDIQYYYFYTGQTLNQLSTLTPSAALEETYFAATRPTVYTILQKGKKNGKDMYACKNITVRPNNQPLFSYTVCGNIVQIDIPKDTLLNDFDYYEMSWGTGNPQTINKNALPFTGNRPIAPTRRIKVEGFFTSGGLNCTAPSFITIPLYTPTNFPLGYNKANHPTIESVELIAKGKAKLSIKGSLNESGYDLFMTSWGQDYPANPLKSGVKVGELLVDLPDTTTQYCFKLIRNVPNCGIEVSAEICTVLLKEVTPVEKDYELQWQVYPEQMTGITNSTTFGRYVNHQEKIIVASGNSPAVTIAADAFNGAYISTIDCREKVCYRIETTTSGQLFYHAFENKSISNEICVDRKAFTPPALTTAFVSVKSPNSAEISYTDNSGWTLLKDKFRLLRFEKSGFVSLDSSAVISGFTDLGIAVTDSSYCYKINYTDECGSTSLPSPEFCTIHLSSPDQRNIDWTTESPFADEDPTTYEIIYFEETSGTAVNETDYPYPTATHSLELSKFEEIARYQIKAIDVNGVESFSNTIEIPIRASIYLPNAFTPNNDGFNNEFIISGNTKRITDYTFTIYNRWGEAIFSTNDLATGWNGKISDNLAPPGYYTYQINANTNTGEAIEQKGVVLLMR
ncbi:MAG: gliding motility-associated C-terminal domain-containing protein [Spirosomaceae bacterium]|nr:gliding motility-associated C-terminal domain-containing protein [Spirosomataceae bacterium]